MGSLFGRRDEMTKRLLILIAIVLLVGVAVWYFFIREKPGEEKTIRTSGNIEAIEVELSFRIPGWVAERPVDEGYTLAKGQLVAKLDTTELEQQVAVQQADANAAKAALAELLGGSRPQEIAQAEAASRKAQRFYEKLVAGSRPDEIAAAEAGMLQVKQDTERLKFEYDREKALFEQGIIAASDWQATEYAYLVSVARLHQLEAQLKLVREGPRKEEIDQAKAAMDLANANYSLVKEGPRKEQIDQARARLDQSQQALAVAQTRLDYATLPSPVPGVVLSKNVEAGEYVSPGTPIVTVADLQDVYLRAYIDETDLGRVKLGQRARITTDTYPGKIYEGVIAFISDQAEFTPKNVQTRKERVKLVYRIKINIRNPNMELKPGMPADAEIALQ